MAKQKVNSDQMNPAATVYSANPTGFSSLSSNIAAYVKIGKLVTVFYTFNGTSNNSITVFNLPFTADSTLGLNFEATPGLTLSNGSVTTPGRCYLETPTTARITGSSTAIASSGTKQLRGVFQYIEA